MIEKLPIKKPHDHFYHAANGLRVLVMVDMMKRDNQALYDCRIHGQQFAVKLPLIFDPKTKGGWRDRSGEAMQLLIKKAETSATI